MTSCPTDKPYLNGTTCVASCSSVGKYADGNNCVSACTGDRPYLENGTTCVTSCSSGKRDGTTCVTSCPTERPNLSDGVCVSGPVCTYEEGKTYIRYAPVFVPGEPAYCYAVAGIHYNGVTIYSHQKTLTGGMNPPIVQVNCSSDKAAEQAYNELTSILPYEKDGYVYTLGNIPEETQYKGVFKLCRQKK